MENEQEYTHWLNQYKHSHESCCHAFATLMRYFPLKKDVKAVCQNCSYIKSASSVQQPSSCDTIKDTKMTALSGCFTKEELRCTVLKSENAVFLRNYDGNNGVYFKLWKIHINQRMPRTRLRVSAVAILF